jgi:hypothetical protein
MPAMWYNRVIEDGDPKLLFCAIQAFHRISHPFFSEYVLKIHSLLLFLMQKKTTFCLFYSNMIFLCFQPIEYKGV